MKQNKYFSPGRFARLLRNDWLINQKTYLFTITSLFIVYYSFTFYLMWVSNKFHNDEYIGLFMANLAIVGIVTGLSFPALTNPNKTSNFLLTPGSTLEKYMVQFVLRFVIFVPITLLIFWISMYLAKASLFPDPTTGINPAQKIPDFHFSILYHSLFYKDILLVLLGIFSMYAFLFTGSVYFKRFALPKTLILFAIIVGTVSLSFVISSHLFFPASTNGFDIIFPIYKINSDTENIKLFFYIIFGCPWLFLLPLAYFKLKEKEV